MDPRATPDVSVVVATRERPDGVRALLDALERQTLARERFEIVIVDDGSSDATADVLRDPRIDSRLRQQPSRGPATARNLGWRAASAPLVAFTDDDCRPSPGWLVAGLEAHRAAPGALVQGRTTPEPGEEHRLAHPRARSIRVEQLGPFFETCNVFYPRSLLERLRGFDETIPTAGSEDTDLAMRAFEVGARAVFAPEALVHHAVHVFSLAQAVRFTYRWRTLVRMLRRHPALRSAFPWRGRIWRETHARLLLALLGLALAPRQRLFLLWCLPYLSYRHGWRPAGLARTLRELPGVAVVDLAELGVLAAASARHRRLLL
jgi:glycosyltransferase involved in cell wall biosynthesis